MANKARDRDRKKGRTTAKREPKQRYLLVCEGVITEPAYFRGYERWLKESTLEIEIADERGTPMTLVEIALERMRTANKEAKRQRDAFLRYDQVWCVFDVDEHPYIPEAKALARQHGINMAISNPCFELWLLLHHREQPGAQHRHKLQAMMKEYVAGYDKHIDFAQSFEPHINQALDRAQRLERQ